MKKNLLLLFAIFTININLSYVKAETLDCAKELSKGSRGKNVEVLQTKLNDLVSCNLNVDGIFGSKTLACVKKYQKKYDITENGIVNSTTCKLINNNNQQLTTKNELDCTTEISRGDKGEIVKQLQKRLNSVLNCNLIIDGVYGNATKACVRKFQMQYELVDTGKLDTTTCQKLTSKTALENKEKTLSVASNSIIVKDEKENAKIRKKASEESSILKTASLGDIYKYSTTTTINDITWYKIKLNSGYGYIQDKYVEKNFIVVDISQQKLILYKNNEVILNTKVVTGTYGKHDTPTGYNVLEKKNLISGKKLIGYKDGKIDYEVWVDYWMPFITKRAIGFHDASWRSSDEYTNTRYLYDGSHGCVNMQKSDAKTLYNNITKDIAVIVRD